MANTKTITTKKEIGLIEVVEKETLKPAHYQGKIECFEVIEELTKNFSGKTAFCLGNIIKYIFRCSQKNGIEDVKKCDRYLYEFINELIKMDKNEIDFILEGLKNE